MTSLFSENESMVVLRSSHLSKILKASMSLIQEHLAISVAGGSVEEEQASFFGVKAVCLSSPASFNGKRL